MLSCTREVRPEHAVRRGGFVAHSSSSSITEKFITDRGASGGSEALSEGKAHLAIRVTPTHAYVSDSSSGLPATQAEKLGERWEE
jgi:hypothetical protein